MPRPQSPGSGSGRIEDLEAQMRFEEGLQIGDSVVARWTNCNRYIEGRATISKINRSSVRATLDHEIKMDHGTWPAGHNLSLPRFRDDKWSWNNGVFPLPA